MSAQIPDLSAVEWKNGQQFVVPQILVEFFTPKNLENMNPTVFFAAIKKYVSEVI